jgi:hypothetical protein
VAVVVAAAMVVGAVAAEVMRRAAVAATAADIDKLTLLVSPKTGAAVGTSTQPATAPAFLFTYSRFSNSNLGKESSALIFLPVFAGYDSRHNLFVQ